MELRVKFVGLSLLQVFSRVQRILYPETMAGRLTFHLSPTVTQSKLYLHIFLNLSLQTYLHLLYNSEVCISGVSISGVCIFRVSISGVCQKLIVISIDLNI